MKLISHMDAVVLCGGLGKRFRSIDAVTPKVLAKINEQPILVMIVDVLKREGITRIILCTGYKADEVEKYFAGQKGIEFSREQEPLGTGGALKQAQGKIKSDYFLVLNGDTFCDVDLKKVFGFTQTKNALGVIVVAPAKDGSRDFGLIQLDASDQILSFDEKIDAKQGGFLNAGVYCLSNKIFSHFLKESKFSLEKDVFPRLTGQKFYGFRSEKALFDIGTPERYREAKDKLKGSK